MNKLNEKWPRVPTMGHSDSIESLSFPFVFFFVFNRFFFRCVSTLYPAFLSQPKRNKNKGKEKNKKQFVCKMEREASVGYQNEG